MHSVAHYTDYKEHRPPEKIFYVVRPTFKNNLQKTNIGTWKRLMCFLVFNLVILFPICFASGLFVLVSICHGKVLELDERFLAAKEHGTWLVMFYAPWCGHCKSLEPTWLEIGIDMLSINPDVNVARLDATKHSSVSSQFAIQGFPTIKFFQGKKEFEYRGARTKDDIIQFVNRAQGPATKALNDETSVAIAREKHDVFYLYVGEDDSAFKTMYTEVADSLMTALDFYTIHPSKLSQNLPLTSTPMVLVFKDGTYYEMSFPAETASFTKLKLWVVSEQIQSFHELSATTYSKLRQSGKMFAIAVLPEKETSDLKDTMKKIALQRIPALHNKFAFAWVLGNKIPNSLTYGTILEQNILVFDSSNYEYFTMFEENSGEVSESTIKQFLHDIIDGKVASKGGSGMMQQIKRVFRDLFNMIFGLFRDSPVIGSLVVGVPILVISMLCYCICTIDDSYREGEYDSEEEEEITADDYPPEYDGDSQEEELNDETPRAQDEGSQAENSQDESQHSQDEGAPESEALRKRKFTKKKTKEEETEEAVEAEDDKKKD